MTLDLPRSLEPWRATLDAFPPDLAPAIGDLVARLSVLIGPLGRQTATPRGDPDGVAGIARRGPFDRLLLSEWALLEEVPDEFLRRAAEDALSFYELARREPSSDRRSIALFDAGPMQLGAPRIVHLAVLVLLAQRAHDARAEFSWGILQEHPPVLYASVSRASVMTLLRARRRELVTAEDAARWRTFLDLDTTVDERELWLVGGARTVDPAGKLPHARITVADSLDPRHPDALDVRVEVPRRETRTARVEIPPARTAVRLIRNPYDTAHGAPADLPMGDPRGYVFSPDRRKLYIRDDTGRLVSLLFFDPRVAPRVRKGRPGDVVLAVGRLPADGRTRVLVATPDGVVFEALGKRERAAASVRHLVDAEAVGRDRFSEGDLAPLFPLSADDSLVLHGRRLTRIHHPADTTSPRAETALVVPALAAWHTYDSAFVVTDEADSRFLRVTIATDGQVATEQMRDVVPAPKSERVVIGNGLIGYVDDGNSARVFSMNGVMKTVTANPGDEIVGIGRAKEDGEPVLVVLDEHRKSVVTVAADGVRSSALSRGEPLERVEVSPYDDRLAIKTKKGTLQTPSLSGRS